MKSEVIKITERDNQLEFVLRIENDAGEVLPEYKWYPSVERTAGILEDEDLMRDELALATREGLAYIQRDKSMVENPVTEKKELDLKKVLNEKVKKGLTKKGIEEYTKKEEKEAMAENSLNELVK